MENWRIDLSLGPLLAEHLDAEEAKINAEEKRLRIIQNRLRTPEIREKMRQSHLGKKRKPFTAEHLANLKLAQQTRRQQQRLAASIS